MMKSALVATLATAATLVAAEDSTSPLTFTYMTFTDGQVETATTIYPLKSTSASSTASSPDVYITVTLTSTTTTNCPTTPATASGWGWPWTPGWPSVGQPAPTQDSNAVWSWLPSAFWPPHHGPPSSASHGPYGSHSSPTETKTSASSVPASTTVSASATPTRYTLNPADLAYPNFSIPAVPSALSANGTFYASEALGLILGANVAPSSQHKPTNTLTDLKNDSAANCQNCKNVMTGLQQNMRTHQDLLGDIATTFCDALPVIPNPICIGLLKVASPYIGGIFPELDMQGDDGALLCAFQLGLCPIPPVPKLDTNTLFKGTKKPAHKPRTPSTKAPLKVSRRSHLRQSVLTRYTGSSHLRLPC